MSVYTNALLNSRILTRPSRPEDSAFERGEGTRAATHAYKKQAASLAAAHVVTEAAKRRPTKEERQEEVARRRKWAGGGNMPEEVRACYSEAERAALSVIAHQCKIKGFCALTLKEIADVAGVKRTSVQNAIRKAASKPHGHISVRERRPQRGVKSLTNIIKIIGKTWLSWIARALSFKRQTGFKPLSTSETKARISLSKCDESSDLAFEEKSGDSPIAARDSCVPKGIELTTGRNAALRPLDPRYRTQVDGQSFGSRSGREVSDPIGEARDDGCGKAVDRRRSLGGWGFNPSGREKGPNRIGLTSTIFFSPELFSRMATKSSRAATESDKSTRKPLNYMIIFEALTADD